MRRLAPVLLLLLGSCSQLTDLSARFIDGQLAFVARDGERVDCVHAFAVTDAVTHAVLWEVDRRAPEACELALPIRYGEKTLATRTPAQSLVPGRRYELDGTAAGGNYLTGGFVITPLSGWRATDVAPEALVDTANDSH
jgi:hypothetical protein